MTLIVPSDLSPGYYIYGNGSLTGLSDGTHNLSIYGETTISGLSESFNQSVSFRVDTLQPKQLQSFPVESVIVVASIIASVVGISIGLLIYRRRCKVFHN